MCQSSVSLGDWVQGLGLWAGGVEVGSLGAWLHQGLEAEASYRVKCLLSAASLLPCTLLLAQTQVHE